MGGAGMAQPRDLEVSRFLRVRDTRNDSAISLRRERLAAGAVASECVPAGIPTTARSRLQDTKLLNWAICPYIEGISPRRQNHASKLNQCGPYRPSPRHKSPYLDRADKRRPERVTGFCDRYACCHPPYYDF